MTNDMYIGQFMQLPQFLFKDPYSKISSNAKLLYTCLLNRHYLSKKNEWKDKTGRTYIIFTRSEMQEILGVTDKTLKKAINELVNMELLEDKKMGLNKANRLYVKAPEIGHGIIPDQETEKTPCSESDNLQPSNTNSKLIDFSDFKSSSKKDISDDEFKDQIDYDLFEDPEKPIVDTIIAAKKRNRGKIKISSKVIDLEALFKNIDHECIKTAVSAIINHSGKVANIDRYIITCLHNLQASESIINRDAPKKRISTNHHLCEREKHYTEEELETMLRARKKMI